MLVLKVSQVAFAVACFWGLSNSYQLVFGWTLNGSISRDKHAASCKLSHNWLVSLAIVLAALWVKIGTSSHHLALFSVDLDFACHFVTPQGVECLWYWLHQWKNYLKWWEIQLAIHLTVDAKVDYKQLYNNDKLYASIYFPF